MNTPGPDLHLLSRLAGRTAHDLNNVLAVLSGHIYLLRSAAEPAEEAFEAMEKVMEDLQRLVGSLAAIGALSQEEAAPVDVNEAVSCACAGRPRVELDLQPGIPPLHARRADLERAVRSLVANASEASDPAQGVRVRVSTLSEPESGVRIQVEDRGPGIPAEVRRRSFEPLFSTSGTKGRGIGITVATLVAAELGGSLEIEEHPGGGTRATLRLPASHPGLPNPS